MGSGSEPVYATPAMVALMEAAAVEAVERHLPDGQISLGIEISVDHIAATPVGQTITAIAQLIEIDGRKLTFAVEAHDGIEAIGRGRHVRVAVDRERFAKRLAAKSTAPG